MSSPAQVFAPNEPGPITRWLSRAGGVGFSAYAITAAFFTYFCMYAFRKPFAVGTFASEPQVEVPLIGAMDYKIVLIIAQVIGYCLSKFIGIKVISEMAGNRRGLAILATIGIAEFALALFAVVPAPYNALCLFLNGIPLGMVWGLVFGYLEGRRLSEALGAGLSGSYIVASMFVKTVGGWVMEWGVSEFWMPFVTGLIFLPFLLFFVWMLSKLPPPTPEDEALRTRREPMDGPTRVRFLKRFAPGLFFLTGLYMLLTAFRDFRDNFSREIWDSVGYAGEPEIMTYVEIPVAIGVLIALGTVLIIKDNRRALLFVLLLMGFGTAMIGVATLAYQAQMIGPVPWMILVGLGLYLGYVPYGCILFDRLIAAVGFVATAGFMIYVTDAFGYLGSVGLLFYKNFGEADLSWHAFFIGFAYVTSIVCTASFFVSAVYFRRAGRLDAGAS